MACRDRYLARAIQDQAQSELNRWLKYHDVPQRQWSDLKDAAQSFAASCAQRFGGKQQDWHEMMKNMAHHMHREAPFRGRVTDPTPARQLHITSAAVQLQEAERVAAEAALAGDMAEYAEANRSKAKLLVICAKAAAAAETAAAAAETAAAAAAAAEAAAAAAAAAAAEAAAAEAEAAADDDAAGMDACDDSDDDIERLPGMPKRSNKHKAR